MVFYSTGLVAYHFGKPIGIAEYELVRALPEPLVANLPTVEQLESELSDWQDEDGQVSGISG